MVTGFEIKMIVKSCAMETVFKSWRSFIGSNRKSEQPIQPKLN